MANQSAKKNEVAIKGRLKFMNFVMYPLFALFVIVNMIFAISQSISFWHLIWVVLIAALSYFCIKQTIKCWQLQLPSQASEYYIDMLALNTIVAVLDPFTHKVWYICYLLQAFILASIGVCACQVRAIFMGVHYSEV